MNDYRNYHTEDFVLDAQFQKWVRYQDEESTRFWNNFRINHPEKTGDIETASILLEGVYLPGTTLLSEEEIQTEILGLISEIQARRSRQANLHIHDSEKEIGAIGLKWWLSAASVALICMFGFWYAQRGTKETGEVAQFEGASVVEKFNSGSANQIVRLEDGSTVELRPGSGVRYAMHFEGNLREIHLSGEALFRVAKDPDRPFLVYTNDLVTRVLGTTFLVRSFKGARESVVEVTEGKVSVYKQADFNLSGNGSQSLAKGVVLTANQKIAFQKDGNVMTKSLADSPKIVPSIKSQPAFVYRNTPIGEVLKDIERAFDEEQLKDCPVTAALVNQSLLEKIEIICETVEARFEVLDGQIIVYGKKCTE